MFKKLGGEKMKSKKLLLIVSAFVLILSFITPGFSASANAQIQTEKVIVVFKDKIDKNIILNARGKVNKEYNNIPALSVSIPSQAINGLKNNPNISIIEKDIPIKINSQTQDWGISRTNAPFAWESNITGKNIKISIVDTGVSNHKDLQVVEGVSFVSDETSYEDNNGHGTHVAGIIGARNNKYGTVGIAPEADLYAVKVLNKEGIGYLSDVIAGIDWSIKNKMDIINLSLGTTTPSSSLEQIVDEAYGKGILIVAAAGNNGTQDGLNDTIEYPARYESVIAVGATNIKDERLPFSATGSSIEVVAPGENIYSTYLKNNYTYMSGTSMATPYVAGNLALLKQQNPTLTNIELREKLHNNTIDLGIKGRDTSFGYGLIQVPAPNKQE